MTLIPRQCTAGSWWSWGICCGSCSLPIHAPVEDNWKMCLIVVVVPTTFFFSLFFEGWFLVFFSLLSHFSCSAYMSTDLESQYPWHHISILLSLAYVSWPVTWWYFGFEGGGDTGADATLRNNRNEVALELAANDEVSALISACEYDWD